MPIAHISDIIQLLTKGIPLLYDLYSAINTFNVHFLNLFISHVYLPLCVIYIFMAETRFYNTLPKLSIQFEEETTNIDLLQAEYTQSIS